MQNSRESPSLHKGHIGIAALYNPHRARGDMGLTLRKYSGGQPSVGHRSRASASFVNNRQGRDGIMVWRPKASMTRR